MNIIATRKKKSKKKSVVDSAARNAASITDDMSPFTFTDIGSADPAVYSEFCDFIKVDKIEIENSYELACKYVEWIGNPYVTTAFEWVTKEDWIDKCKIYMKSDHKTS